MKNNVRRMFRTLADMASHPDDQDCYLRALGETPEKIDRKVRLAQLLEQFRSADPARMMKAFLILKTELLSSDKNELREFREIVRQNLFSSDTEEKMKIKLLHEFTRQEFTDEELRKLMRCLGIMSEYIRPDFTNAVQEKFQQMLTDSTMLSRVCSIIKADKDGYHASEYFSALEKALENPIVAVECLKAAFKAGEPTRLELSKSLDRIVKTESASVNISDPYFALCAHARVTKALIDSMLQCTDEEYWNAVASILGAGALGELVVKLACEGQENF